MEDELGLSSLGQGPNVPSKFVSTTSHEVRREDVLGAGSQLLLWPGGSGLKIKFVDRPVTFKPLQWHELPTESSPQT